MIANPQALGDGTLLTDGEQMLEVCGHAEGDAIVVRYAGGPLEGEVCSVGYEEMRATEKWRVISFEPEALPSWWSEEKPEPGQVRQPKNPRRGRRSGASA